VSLGATTCIYSHETCEQMLPLIHRIQKLKREKNAVILAHSYVSPEIALAVADYSGDSYQLSKDATKTQADIIVFAAVRFMAETAKILNPTKRVLIPGTETGCTLADSIDANAVRQLRDLYPDYTFVCYINTTAEVKALCDICVTSSNVYKIVQNYPNDKIFFLPDKLMGQNLIEEMKRRGVNKDIRTSDGVCYVHEQYDPEMIQYLRLKHPKVKVLSHPECSPSILHESDFTGSTSQMLDYVHQSEEQTFLMLTECGLTARLQTELPNRQFIGSCTMCRYMKSNSLEGILRVLENPQAADEVHLDSALQKAALKCIQNMFAYA